MLVCHLVPSVLLYRKFLLGTLQQSSKVLDCRYHKRVWKLVWPREMQPRYANVHALQRATTSVVDSTVHYSLLGVCIAHRFQRILLFSAHFIVAQSPITNSGVYTNRSVTGNSGGTVTGSNHLRNMPKRAEFQVHCQLFVLTDGVINISLAKTHHTAGNAKLLSGLCHSWHTAVAQTILDSRTSQSRAMPWPRL